MVGAVCACGQRVRARAAFWSDRRVADLHEPMLQVKSLYILVDACSGVVYPC